MKKKFAFLGMVALLILGPAACSLLETCPEVSPFFQIEALQLNHYQLSNDAYGEAIIPNSNTHWQDYGLKTDFRTTYYASSLDRPGGANLFALSCVDAGYLGTEIGVDTLYLVTLDDYNDEYQKNDTLNNILLVNDYFEGVDFYPLAQYLMDNRESIRLESFTLKLDEGPAEDVAINFELIYLLKDGSVFKQQSSIVNLLE